MKKGSIVNSTGEAAVGLRFGFVSRQDFSRSVKDGRDLGFRVCVRTSIFQLSPAGTAENVPRRNPGQPTAVPSGLRLEMEFSHAL
jgi:hypothetical protein